MVILLPSHLIDIFLGKSRCHHPLLLFLLRYLFAKLSLSNFNKSCTDANLWNNYVSYCTQLISSVQKAYFSKYVTPGRIVKKKLALPIWGWQMSILDVSFQSLVVMIEHGTSLIIEPGVMMRISWHTTPKWTRPMSRSKIQTRCHFLHSSCSEI